MIPLEDTAADVIGKAQRGLGLSDSQLAARTGIDVETVRAARTGDGTDDTLRRLAPVLQLDPAALVALASGSYRSEAREIDGVAMFNTPFDDMRVNAFLVWDPRSRAAIVFDSGADCAPMLQQITDAKLDVQLILLTHAHPDHVADLKRLREATGASIYISDRESAAGAEGIPEGREFSVGGLRVICFLTWGHSRGGMTYFVTGLASPVAVVGDAIFAGSMGGGNVSYADALQTNSTKILSLPDETIICPGHGPLTTVGHEKRHNPFFASSFREQAGNSAD